MSTVIRSLLYRAEDTSVEFKSEQYAIAQDKRDEGDTPADARRRFEAKKSELLKDVLAMANAWRDGPGYIVIGVKDIQGAGTEVVGLPDDQLFDDAQFQQFINEKLARPVNFTYLVDQIDGKNVGLVTVPRQKGRPFFAKKEFGGVQANTVYVRRGTSTAIADPTEIAHMGQEDIAERKTVSVDFLVRGLDDEPLLDTCQEFTLRDFEDIGSIADYSDGGRDFYASFNRVNRHYWRELATMLQAYSSVIPVKVSLRSRSNHALRGCKLELTVTDGAGERLDVMENSDMPSNPERYLDVIPKSIFQNFRYRDESETVRAVGNGSCIFGFRLLRPGETVGAPEKIFIRISGAELVNLSFRLLSEDLQEPLEFNGAFTVKAQVQRWDEDRLVAWAGGQAEKSEEPDEI